MSGKEKYIIAVLLYGTIGTLVQYIALPSEVIVLCRGAIGTLTILLFCAFTGHRLHIAAIKKELPCLIGSGVCLGLNWAFLFSAYRYTTVAVGSLCNYTAPIIAVVLSAILYRQPLHKKEFCCILAALLGIILVSGVLDSAGMVSVPGIAQGLLAALAFVGIILFNRHLHDMDALDRSVVPLGISALVMLPYVLFTQHGVALHPDTRSLLLILLLGVVQTGIAYIFYFDGMAHISVQSVAILGYLEPVLSILLSAILLHQLLSPLGILGAVLILGAALCNELDLSALQKQKP